MPKVAPLLALALVSACRASAPMIKLGAGADLTRYRRIGVLPFREAKGDGRAPAAILDAALRRRGFATVDAAQMAPVFESLRLSPGDELGLEQLLAVRQATQAEALAFGSVLPRAKRGGQRLLILIIDGASGELVVRGEGDVPPPDLGGVQAAMEGLLESMQEEFMRDRKEPAMEKLEEP